MRCRRRLSGPVRSLARHITRAARALWDTQECVANHVNNTNKHRTSQNNDWPRASAACMRINVQVTHQQLLRECGARMPYLARCLSALQHPERVANHVNNINKPRTSQNNVWPRVPAACTHGNVQVTHQHLLVAPQACMHAVVLRQRNTPRATSQKGDAAH